MSKPADLMVLRKSKKERAAQDGAAFMVSVNAVFNRMIDNLRTERAKNQRLREAIREMQHHIADWKHVTGCQTPEDVALSGNRQRT